jgi:hypothetical protein
MMVDLGEGRALAVSHYALRTGGYSSHGHPVNWELQGGAAADGPWTTLLRHTNDASFTNNGMHEVAAWPVVGEFPPFRFLRVYQFSSNKRGNAYLCVGGLEFYGELAFG